MGQTAEPSDLQPGLLEQFTHSANSVMGVDGQQRIILWNHAAEELLGYAAAEVLGQYCYNLMKACGGDNALACQKHCSQFEQARKLHWPSQQILRTVTKAGKQVRLAVISVCLFSSQQKFCALIHVFWDAGESPQLSDSEAKPPPGPPAPSPLPFLTSQERKVLGCLAAGIDTKIIANMLFISPTTVRNHIQGILRKLGVHSRLEAVAVAHHLQWS